MSDAARIEALERRMSDLEAALDAALAGAEDDTSGNAQALAFREQARAQRERRRGLASGARGA